jgi:DNA primase
VDTAYQKQPEGERQPPLGNPDRYRGVSYVRPIDAAKEAVPVIDLADRLTGPGGLRRVGKEWAGHCPLPDHEDKTPSFTVSPEKNVFWCFGCLRGGDVVELARLAWEYDQRDAHIAAADLLHEFGHELPERAPAWFRKQERQRHTRDAVEEVRKNILRRRLFKHLILPLIDAIEDEEEHKQELDRAWGEFQRLVR